MRKDVKRDSSRSAMVGKHACLPTAASTHVFNRASFHQLISLYSVTIYCGNNHDVDAQNEL